MVEGFLKGIWGKPATTGTGLMGIWGTIKRSPRTVIDTIASPMKVMKTVIMLVLVVVGYKLVTKK
jgi:hypothetical protein